MKLDRVYLVEVHNWDSHGGWEYVTTAHPSRESAIKSIEERLGFKKVVVEGKVHYIDPDWPGAMPTKACQLFQIRRAGVREVPFYE